MKLHWPPSTQLSPIPAVIVSVASADGLTSNLITIAWTGIVCSKPPMCYISVRPDRYSHQLLKESGEFAINLTTKAMARATDLLGVISGRKSNKWEASALTPCPAHVIKAPLVAESPLSLECRTKEIITLGSHDMFIADIVGVAVEESLVLPDGKLDLAQSDLLVYSHGEYFSQGDFLGHFGWSVKKKASKNNRK